MIRRVGLNDVLSIFILLKFSYFTAAAKIRIMGDDDYVGVFVILLCSMEAEDAFKYLSCKLLNPSMLCCVFLDNDCSYLYYHHHYYYDFVILIIS